MSLEEQGRNDKRARARARAITQCLAAKSVMAGL